MDILLLRHVTDPVEAPVLGSGSAPTFRRQTLVRQDTSLDLYEFRVVNQSADCRMGDCAEELEELDDVRLDIEMLRTMIDLALDKGVTSDDALLKACADVLYERRVRLDQLEAMMRNAPDS